MRYRRLGRTNLKVSELGYGSARGAIEDRRQFINTVKATVDAGMNFVDTAGGYEDGACESALGEALRGNSDVIIETKYRPYDGWAPEATYTGSSKELLDSVDSSLRRLERDQIDIFLGHGIRTLESLDRFMTDGCLDTMIKLRDQGKIRFIGISELSEGDGTHEILKRAVPTGVFDVVMLTLNFVLQTAAETVLSLCAKHDVGTVVMMPLNQASGVSGLVSIPAAMECLRRHIEAGHLPNKEPYTNENIFDFLQPYSIPEAALRYVLSHDVSCCCVGMRTPERLKENLRAIDPPYLDENRLTKLRELFAEIQEQTR